MFVVNKDYTDMAINYQRRLSGTDKFLTTTSTGKRIEVKSDLLTEKYNTKIMKNIKELIEEFQNEAKKRILQGKFKVVNSIIEERHGYLGQLEISIDELIFQFSIHSSMEYVAEHYPFKIGIESNSIQVKKLYNAFKEHSKPQKEAEIKRLQEKIKELQK